MLKSQCSGWIATITYIICLFTLSILYVYTIYLLYVSLFAYHILYFTVPCCCFVHRHGKTLSSRNDPIFFFSLHLRNLSLYNKITTTHFKQIRFWWKNVIKFRGKVYSNFFKFVKQLFFLSARHFKFKIQNSNSKLNPLRRPHRKKIDGVLQRCLSFSGLLPSYLFC